MRTETPRIRQLTFQLGHAPCVLTPRALAAKATAPSHPLSADRKVALRAIPGSMLLTVPPASAETVDRIVVLER